MSRSSDVICIIFSPALRIFKAKKYVLTPCTEIIWIPVLRRRTHAKGRRRSHDETRVYIHIRYIRSPFVQLVRCILLYICIIYAFLPCHKLLVIITNSYERFRSCEH